MSELNIQGKRRSELIKVQCRAVFEFFNNVFGEGTDKTVFGDSVNLTTCINAFEQVIQNVNTTDARLSQQLTAKYKGNRQQRRNQQKNKNKGKNKQYNQPRLVTSDEPTV